MSQGQLGSLLQHIRRLVGGAAGADAPDAQLLEAFIARREEAAFTSLVQRHGPLVLGVCRRVMADAHEAEDAFQAVFMILAKRAGAVRRPEALASWLYGVAYRVAARARGGRGKRSQHESQVTSMPGTDGLPNEQPSREVDPISETSRRELRAIIDEELSRLPEKYRLPMVLCYLEGKSNEEAARQLHWTKGTVSGQLARGRDLLRHRLARRGIALSAGAMARAITQTASAAVVPPALVESAVHGALAFTTATAAGSVYATTLARETLHAMFLSKCRTVAALVVAALVIVGGAGAVTYHHVHRPAPEAIADNPAGKSSPNTQPATQEQPPHHDIMDRDRADKVPVVLRVRLVKPAAGVDKYGWDEVEVLHVLKNTSGQHFGKTLSVAFVNTRTGVPAGLSTIYLEPYNAQLPNNGHWKLLNGGAPDGVSHPAHR